MNNLSYPKNLDSALNWDYKFWNTQPVPKLKEKIFLDAQINDNILNEIPKQCNLPDEFEWGNINISDEKDLEEISNFLDKYYEDTNEEFRLHFTSDYIKWLYSKNIHKIVCVRVKKNNLLIGLICGKLINVKVNKNELKMININLLCIHPKLRNKRLAPVLITEIKRLFIQDGFKNAVYSTPNYLPTPTITANNYRRVLNINTLVETEFIKLEGKLKLGDIKKATKLPDKPFCKNFKKMENSHLEEAYIIFNKYMEKYNISPIFTKEEFAHVFIDNKYMYSYVSEDEYGNVLDFASYYTLNYTVIKKNEKHKFIKKGFLYYYTCLEETPYRLIKDLLIMAKANSVDLFNAIDIMEHEIILRDLTFDQSNGMLNLYFYNWKIKPLKNFQVGLIL